MDIDQLLQKAKELPNVPGCYIMKNTSGEEIYVGKAKNLRKRVSSYFLHRDRLPKEAALIENIHDFDYIETESEVEAFLLENRLIKDFQPRYNVMLKNNELYPFIEVTMGEDFPRVLVTRRQADKKSRIFGPFISATDVRACINQLQRVFLFRTCSRNLNEKEIRHGTGRSCLNWQINRCSGACRGKISKEEYRKRIVSLCRFLSGQKKELITDLKKEMQEAAKNLQFENAARLRDLIASLENIHSQTSTDDSLTPPPPEYDPEKGLEALREGLGLAEVPRRIEGIDIANLQGKEVVGSLVYFLNGMPFKDGYRRFKIKTVQGQDDFACINEVATRRYGKLVREDEELPDIILIDGGKGQLASAQDALASVGARVPALISIAKEEETIFRFDADGKASEVPFSKRNAGLRMLMYVRDEAHRFAQHYHHILRRKAMFNGSEPDGH